MNKKQLRESFRNSVFKRDSYTCRVCNEKKPVEELDAHHITDRNLMPNGGYVLANGITVCNSTCHMIVEEFHISDGEDWVEGYHPNDLYKLINSSYHVALEDSSKL